MHKEVLLGTEKKERDPAVVKLNEAIGRFKVCACAYVYVYGV